MKQKSVSASRQSLTRRFLYPSMLVFGIWLAMNLIYANAWKFDLGGINTVISWVCGLGDLIFRVLTPLIIYAIACPRGASLAERVVASMVPSFGWAAYQLYLAAGVFSIGETVYYGFSSAFLFVFCVLISVMGLCELVCRLTAKQHRQTKNRLTGPILAILMGPLSVFVLMVWGGGVHFFYVYQEGYKLLFNF